MKTQIQHCLPRLTFVHGAGRRLVGPEAGEVVPLVVLLGRILVALLLLLLLVVLAVAGHPILVGSLLLLLIVGRGWIVQAEFMAHFEGLADRPHDAHRLALRD